MAINNLKGRLPMRITPYFASLIYRTGYSHPLRRNVIPVVEELYRIKMNNQILYTKKLFLL
jgi:L-lysine 2,3-aminomutase